MSKIRVVPESGLTAAPPSPGIVRRFAFQGDGFLVVRATTEPGAVSGWHHHGDYDVYGYVVSGTVAFNSGRAGQETTTVGRGEYFHVPQHLVHRDVNPSQAEGQEVILFLQGSGPMVVNVDGPEAG